MATLKRIYELRQDLDRERQPRLATLITKLVQLVDAAAEHPYELPPGSERALFELAGGDDCAHATAAWSDETDYLYRLHPLASALRSLRWRDYAEPLAAGAVDELLIPVFERLKSDANHALGWLGLSTYASGEIANDRGFSWWTTFEGICDDPWFGGHRLGMPDRWIPMRALLLRCEAAAVTSLARVPTTIDGFYSPVFASAPLTDSTTRSAGHTIDLRGDGAVAFGVAEYALGPVPLPMVEFLPMFVEDRPEPRVPWDASTWRRVAAGYEDMKNGRW